MVGDRDNQGKQDGQDLQRYCICMGDVRLVIGLVKEIRM